MAFRIFLDANVCLDFVLRREKYDVTKQVFQKIFNNDLSAFITPAIVHICSFYISKYYDKTLTKKIILDLLAYIKVIDCNHQTTLNAVTSDIADIENALQYHTAMQHKAEYFLSYDKKLIRSSTRALPIYSPEEFLLLFA